MSRSTTVVVVRGHGSAKRMRKRAGLREENTKEGAKTKTKLDTTRGNARAGAGAICV